MAEATKWYLAKGDQAVGPYDLARLRQMAAAGAVHRDDLVCPEGGSEWLAATTVPGLFGSPPPIPPRAGAAAGLVPCAKCGKRVSDEAVACPHCGAPQPKQEQLDGKCDGGKCETCGTFNLLGVVCSFPAHPNFTCRGCRRPLTEAYPTAHLYSEMERIHLNGLRAGRFGGIVGAVAGVLLLVAMYQAAGGVQNLPGGPLLVVPAMFFVVAAYAAGRWIVIRVLRSLAARSGLGDPSPLADQIRAHIDASPNAWGSLERYRTETALYGRLVRNWAQNGTFVYVPR